MKEILVDMGNWSVCRYTKEHLNHQVTVYAEHQVTVYAEHVIGCSEKPSKNASSWGWEHDDRMGPDGYEACWKCAARVPKDIVAIVVLYNWGELGRIT